MQRLRTTTLALYADFGRTDDPGRERGQSLMRAMYVAIVILYLYATESSAGFAPPLLGWLIFPLGHFTLAVFSSDHAWHVQEAR